MRRKPSEWIYVTDELPACYLHESGVVCSDRVIVLVELPEDDYVSCGSYYPGQKNGGFFQDWNSDGFDYVGSIDPKDEAHIIAWLPFPSYKRRDGAL